MNHCSVDIEFLYNEENFVFAKSVTIYGFTALGNPYAKEIKYQYPSLVIDINRETPRSCGHDILKPKFANLEYHRTDAALAQVLTKFKIVLVDGSDCKEFISNYTTNSTKIIDISESSK